MAHGPTSGGPAPDHLPVGLAAETYTEQPIEIPPLPDDATPEQKDEHWLRYVYRGDRMPQLTVRAVVMGGFLGMLMSAANLYTSLAIGWGFGIAITACVLSFLIWNFVRLCSGNRVSQMSILENACMASTASAAGYATGSTIATMFGALVLLYEVPAGMTAADVKTWDVSPPWVVTTFTLLTGLMGVFLAIPMKRQLINHEQLPFPSGTAAAETLTALYSASKAAVRKGYVLIGGLVAGLIVGFLRVPQDVLDKVPFLNRVFEWGVRVVRIPGEIEMHLITRYPREIHPTGFAFEPSALLIAAGMIVGLRISTSMLVSSLLLYVVVGPYLAAQDVATTTAALAQLGTGADAAALGAAGFKLNLNWPGAWPASVTEGLSVVPFRWSLWGGTAVMVFSSLTSVALQWKTLARAFGAGRGTATAEGAARRAIEVPGSWMVIGMVPITIAMVWLQIVAFGVSWWAGLIAVGMSFILSLVASRATGETDTTPIGAMGKVMQLLFAGLVPRNIGANLASAGIAANSAIASADLLTDLKTGYLLGANPRRQFLAQFFGVFFGTLAIVPIWYLMVPTKEKLESFALPSTRAWEAVARVLVKGVGELPPSAIQAIVIGAVVGVLLPVIERLLPARARRFMPSAAGIGLAWVIPFQNAFSFFVGAMIAWVWSRVSKRTAENYNVPLASGLVAGESLMLAALAITATVVGLMA